MDKQLLTTMLNELNNYKRDKKELLDYYINIRLTKSIEQYYRELDNSLSYLVSQNALRVAKKFNKM